MSKELFCSKQIKVTNFSGLQKLIVITFITKFIRGGLYESMIYKGRLYESMIYKGRLI